MSKPVLFATGLGREITRAENMATLFDSYPGDKKFMSTHSDKYREEVKSGKYDLLVIDIFPTFAPKKCIMMWHAIQGGKYIGLDEKTTYYSKDYAKLMDAIIVAGRGGIDMFHQCTAVPKERIFNLGMPRTDKYFRMKAHDPMVEGKRMYLFAPTFRNWRDTPMPMYDWEKLDRLLHDDEIMVVKAHPYGLSFDIEGRKHIIEADKMYSSAQYLFDCSAVVTDYSSIMFDGYLMNKPCVLFEKKTGYTKTRGMYMQYPDMYSSRYATTEEELVEQLRSAKRLRNVEKACKDYVADMCDGHSCERICKFIEEMNNGE